MRGIPPLKPQDIVMLLRVHLESGSWTYARLARKLAMSASEVHAGLSRAAGAHLYHSGQRAVRLENFREFLEHGIRYAFPAAPGPMTRGLPTAWFTTPLAGLIGSVEGPRLVWPTNRRTNAATAQGAEIIPLYRTVPEAAATDPELYTMLALIDGVRLGRSRERALAWKELSDRLVVESEEPRIDPEILAWVNNITALVDFTGDLRTSQPLQEVIALIDRDRGLPDRLRVLEGDDQQRIRVWAGAFLQEPARGYLVEEHLPRGENAEMRQELVLARIARLSNL